MLAGHPQGSTTVAAVLGSPVRHSLSPLLLNAAFDASGLDWVYVAFDVTEAQVAAALTGMRALRLGGASVTMPLKAAVLAHVDHLDADVVALGAANCLWWDGSRLCASSTDGPGLIAALADDGIDLSGRRVAVLGAGGAARAVVRAAALAGAAEVAVVNRTADRAEAACALAGAVGRVVGPEAIAQADVVINATSVGMDDTDAAGGLAVPVGSLHASQVIMDLVYHPRRTPMLAAAEEVGARALDGVGMLVHQAALAFERWTGERAPVPAMRASVLAR